MQIKYPYVIFFIENMYFCAKTCILCVEKIMTINMNFIKSNS